MKYVCHDFFMIRTPALPVKIASNLDNISEYSDIWDYIVKNDLEGYFKEALQVSSYSLYEALGRVGKDKNKDKEAYISLYKYLQRAATRTTPYGLLANVAIGEFAKAKNEKIIVQNINKKINADNLWVFKLIKKIEKDFSVRKCLSLIWNNSCYIMDNRIRNPHFSNYGIEEKKNSKKSSSIRMTNLTQLIQDNTHNFISYVELIKIIKAYYPNVDDKKIYNTIDTLINQEYLFTDLRVSAYEDDILSHIIDILEKHNTLLELAFKLRELRTNFNRYEKTDLGKGEHLLNNIITQMKQIQTSTSFIEVNTGRHVEPSFLNTNIKVKLEKLANTIKDIGIKTESYTPLKDFKRQFQEEYGTNIEVPLIQVIDPCGFDGLKYYYKTTFYNINQESRIRKFFDIKLQEALLNGENKVNLTQADFACINDENFKDLRFSDSFDMNIIISGHKDKLHLSVGPNFGSGSAGKMFQRFNGIFDKNQFEKYNLIYEKVNEGKEYILVELREMPNSGRLSNVINCNKNYKYFLALGLPTGNYSQEEILLKDLVVGLNKEEHLYIKSISKNKICKMVTDNMLNPMLNSKLFNLLKAISSDYEQVKVVDRLGSLFDNNYVYIPQIVIEGVTVSPEKWRFTEENLNGKSLEKFKNSFEYCVKRYNISDYFYLCQLDQRLMLHRTENIAIEILYQEFKDKKKVELCSLEDGFFDNEIVKNKEAQSYIAEFVFSFYSVNNKKIELLNKNILIQNEFRILPPFAEGWVYLKIYCSEEMENDFLSELLENKEKLKMNNFFYIRYADEIGRHLRVRIKYSNEKEALESYLELNQWLQNLRTYGLLRFWSLNEYRRENNRYGGSQIIEKIEELFFADSEYVINLIKDKNMQDREIIDTVYFDTLCKLLFNLIPNKCSMLEILDKSVSRQSYRKDYKEKRKNYIGRLEDIFEKEKEKDSRKNIASFVSKVILDTNTGLTNSVDNIVLSLLHMCCNRLSGDSEIEEKSYALLRHTLYDVIKKEQYFS